MPLSHGLRIIYNIMFVICICDGIVLEWSLFKVSHSFPSVCGDALLLYGAGQNKDTFGFSCFIHGLLAQEMPPYPFMPVALYSA